MSHTADQLLALAANLDNLAAELLTEANDEKHSQFMEWLTKHYGYTHEQYSKFSREAKNHLHNLYENEKHEETKKEASGQTFDEKDKEDKEWQKSHPKMRDWSSKDWSKYLSKDKKPKDSNDAKDKKKLDPKAKVRNRGTVCVPASSAKDKKDHFPINDEAQARNALARVHQYSSVPSWYSGSLKSLQELVSRKVHSKYKGIGKSEKKSSVEFSETLLIKYC